MTKDAFLSILEHKLTDGGMPKELVNKSVSRLNQRFSSMSEDECAQYIDKIGGEDAVAEQILSEYKKGEAVKKTADKRPQTAEKTDAKRAPTSAKADKQKDDMSDLFDDDISERPRKKPVSSNTTQNPAVRKKTSPAVKSGKPTAPNTRSSVNKNQTSHGKSAGGKQKGKLSVGVILCMPFLIALALLIAILIASLYVVVALAVVVFAALLVVLTAAGTAFFVIAVIYGITQMAQAGGAGLYEMGIGVIVGGITMFVGILMYNFIVRLAPFIYKKLLVLIKFATERLKKLYENVREASQNI